MKIAPYISLRALWVLLLMQVAMSTYAQQESDTTTKEVHWSVGGYIKDMQTTAFTDINKKWTLVNLIHNRINASWFSGKGLKINASIRNRFFYGDSLSLYSPGNIAGYDKGYFGLSRTLAKGPSYLLHTTLDRAFIDYTHNKWQVSIGRQRINWGLNIVWNPNDIFNAYSYFNFDYEEKPGSDAARIQYYINSTSSLELAYSPGRSSNESVGAGLYRFNKKGYDIQLLAGWMDSDYVVGAGWTGALARAGFNGEFTAFTPRKNPKLSGIVVSASLGINYTFQNSLYLHGAYLLNSAGLLRTDSLSPGLLLNNVTSKSLSPMRHSLFAEVAYQFHPLVRGNLSGIVDPSDGSIFVGPFLNFSVSNTTELLAGAQLFFGDQHSLYGKYGQAAFIRLKWSF